MTTSPVMTITDEVLAELEAAAKAATPGPWVVDEAVSVCPSDAMHIEVATMQPVDKCQETGRWRFWDESKANARHVALNDPGTVTALLRHIAELKERCATAEKDARRYAWIRDQHNDGLGRTWVAVYQPGEWVSLDTFVQGDKAETLDLDKSVDAAMEGQS